MKKWLLIIILIMVAAFLVVLPFSPTIIHGVKNRLRSVKNTYSLINPTHTSPLNRNSLGALISYNLPTFASSESYPASNANDNSYDTTWRSHYAPAWLAYNLSSVPIAKRDKVLVVWYNGTGHYDHTLIGDVAYNMPQDYTIDASSASGGANPPTSGWVTLETVRGNHYHSRQHIVTITGYNWLRINITAIDGSSENYDASINMDIYDAHTALADDWIFYGDSITEGAMTQETLNGTVALAQLINAHIPNDYPVEESGATGYLSSADGVQKLNTWLSLFPGKYVGLSYGTNDALQCIDSATFYNNYLAIVQDVLNAGKIPLVPYIPWGRNTKIQSCAPALNAQITLLYKTFPSIIHGPDLWSFFQSHQNLISNDGIHPNTDGFAAYRQQWTNVILTEVYHK